MAFYNFWALSETNETVRATILANSKDDARIRLESYGYRPFTITPVWHMVGVTFTDQDRSDLCASLKELLNAGISLHEALSSLAKDQRNLKNRIACQTFADGIHFGLGMRALACHAFFDEMAIHSLHLAQKTGRLADVFGTLAQYYADQFEAQKEWRRILRYPIFVGIMLCTLMYLLGVLVLPNLESFIPATSKGWAFQSFKYMVNHMLSFGVGILTIGVGIYRLRHLFDYIPFFARYRLTHFWDNLAFCLSHDMSLVDAIDIAQQGIPAHIQTSLGRVRQQLIKGSPIDEAFSEIPYLPATLQSLIRLSQKTGQLKQMISQIAQIERKFKKDLINFIMLWTQPFLVFMMGLVILWILHATLVPLYDSFAALQQ